MLAPSAAGSSGTSHCVSQRLPARQGAVLPARQGAVVRVGSPSAAGSSGTSLILILLFVVSCSVVVFLIRIVLGLSDFGWVLILWCFVFGFFWPMLLNDVCVTNKWIVSASL